MKTRVLIASCLLLTVAVCLSVLGVSALGQEAKDTEAAEKASDDKFVQLVESDENLFATECWGKWKMDDEFTRYVAHELPEKSYGTMEFEKNEKESKRIVRHLERLAEKMKERGQPTDIEFLKALKAVYATGTVKIKRGGKSMTATFAMFSLFGEPMLILLEGETPNTEWETVRISFVRDPKGDHDLLFVGGHKEDSYIAMKRDGVE